MSTADVRERAQNFVENETAFHLGALPTEQSHPATADLSNVLRADVRAGLSRLLAVDEDIVPVTGRILASEVFGSLAQAFFDAMCGGNRIVFTGCGATGRLSILLDAAWRECWQRIGPRLKESGRSVPDLEDLTVSVMAGGDYALIRSVEGFEDFTRFGRRQLRETGVGEGDVVVAITEGGETSFVIGTAWEGVASGARVFFVFNNPAPVLAATVERSREVLEDGRITAIDLATGPMAIAGSTRLQATTAELLVVGTALEVALGRFLERYLARDELDAAGLRTPVPERRAEEFRALLEQLREPANLESLADYVRFEHGIYAAGGRVTYAASDFLLDILTDTTERSPTFSLPPFRRYDDFDAPVSWAYLKHPGYRTPEAWRRLLRREPRCLDWEAAVYRELGAPDALVREPPKLDRNELHRFRIGSEDDPSRYATGADVLVWLGLGRTAHGPETEAEERRVAEGFFRMAEPFAGTAVLSLGGAAAAPESAGRVFSLGIRVPPSPLDLGTHLAVKLVLNTVSTATMVLMSRVSGNWMSCVEPGNKKLIDRGTRLIAELTGVDYASACERLFEGIDAVRELRKGGSSAISPVEWAIRQYSPAGRG